MTFFLLVVLAQAAQPVTITNPTNPTKRVTTTTSGAKELLDVNVVLGSGSGGSDGGFTIVIQGPGADGGTRWGVDAYVITIPVLFIQDAGVLNVNPIAVAQIPILFVQDAGVLNINPPTVNQGTSPWVTSIPNSRIGVDIMDAGPPINVNPVVVAQIPIIFVQDAGVLNVQGTFFQATQPVSGPLTDAQLRATPVPVSGTVAVTNLDVTLSSRVAEATFTGRFPAAGALTDNFANPTTTQIAAMGMVWDGATWDRMPGTSADGVLVNLGANNDVTVTGSVTASGTVTANQGTPNSTANRWPVQMTDGTDLAQVSAGGAILVDGTATTQPVSIAATVSENLAQVNAQTVNVGTGTAGTGTQRVAVASDSSITANAGTNLNTSALALSATQTDRSQFTKLTDGTRDGTIKAASTAAGAADTSLVVALSPNSPLPAGAAVIGHVIADTGSTTAVTGNVTVVQPTGTNLHAVLDTTSTTAVTQATAANLNATVVGTKSNNAAAPSTTNVGALGALATAAVQTWSEGNLVLTSVDLSGRTRIDNTSWLGSTAPTVGQKTMANSLPVALASDQTAIPVTLTSTTVTGTVTTTPPTGSVSNDGACVSVTANTTVLASNASRRQAAVCARISNSDTTFVKLAATATTSDFPLEPGQCMNLTAPGSIYTGIIDAIANTGTQSVCVLEVN